MDYFLLNINRKEENFVDEWIETRNIAPIFYGNSTINQIVNQVKQFPQDAYLFIDTFSQLNTDAIIISIGNSNLYIYQQEEKLQEYPEYKDIVDGDLVKGIKIKLLKKIEIKKCPLVLITIKSNRFMSSGAFRKIHEKKRNSYFGNIKAIEYLLKGEKPKVNTFEDYLFCLSSIEFETLIAKMFEEKGYYVPAYKGGFIKNFDLFCKKGQDIISIQIKLNLKKKHYNKYTDLFYCINSEIKEKNVKTWKEIFFEINECIGIKKWLNKTLEWVDYIEEK